MPVPPGPTVGDGGVHRDGNRRQRRAVTDQLPRQLGHLVAHQLTVRLAGELPEPEWVGDVGADLCADYAEPDSLSRAHDRNADVLALLVTVR
jgi:hypothetical protein